MDNLMRCGVLMSGWFIVSEGLGWKASLWFLYIRLILLECRMCHLIEQRYSRKPTKRCVYNVGNASNRFVFFGIFISHIFLVSRERWIPDKMQSFAFKRRTHLLRQHDMWPVVVDAVAMASRRRIEIVCSSFKISISVNRTSTALRVPAKA